MTQDDAIISEIEIAAPPERVFKALTEEQQLILWWNDASCPIKLFEMDARPGGRWRFETQAGEIEVNGVREFKAHGEILELALKAFDGLHDFVGVRHGGYRA